MPPPPWGKPQLLRRRAVPQLSSLLFSDEVDNTDAEFRRLVVRASTVPFAARRSELIDLLSDPRALTLRIWHAERVSFRYSSESIVIAGAESMCVTMAGTTMAAWRTNGRVPCPAAPCRAVPSRAEPSRAVPCRARRGLPPKGRHRTTGRWSLAASCNRSDGRTVSWFRAGC
jgi:hypothetical protein